MKAKEIWLIRHAESLANIGAATSTPREIPLSEKGFYQAKIFAEIVQVVPELIVVSPYLRSQQTAAPLLERFPETPVEVMTVQEFTYLSVSHCRGTSYEQRKPLVAEFWQRGDPLYCDGDQSESVAELFQRAENFLCQIGERDCELAFVFTHEQFIKALIWKFLQPKMVWNADLMGAFYRFTTSFAAPNTAVLKLKIEESGELFLGKIKVSHLEEYA